MSAQPNDPRNDVDSQETREWMDALSAVINAEGPERAHFLLEQLLEHARESSIDMPFSATTGYVNTCLLYTSPSPRDLSTSRMPSSA